MSENIDTTTDSVPAGPVVHEHRDRRLHRVLAWVGIVAGVLFIVAVVFFSGFVLGRSSGGYHGWHRGYQSQMGPGGQTGGCPMMRNGSMTGPGPMMGPGAMMVPDDMGPGMRPSTSPAAPSPGPTR